jgi:hypothetical protein
VKRNLYFGSTNKQKFLRLLKIIQKLPLDIHLLQVDIHKTGICIEDGDSVEENAILKSKYYAEALGEAVIAQDDGLIIDNLQEKDQQVYLHRNPITKTILNPVEIYERWHTLIIEQNITTGVLLKGYALTSGDHIASITIKIPVRFAIPDNTQKVCYNPLNSFMLPQGFMHTFDMFTNEDDSKFTSLLSSYLHPLLEKFSKDEY